MENKYLLSMNEKKLNRFCLLSHKDQQTESNIKASVEAKCESVTNSFILIILVTKEIFFSVMRVNEKYFYLPKNSKTRINPPFLSCRSV
jgi:hypothetical protein